MEKGKKLFILSLFVLFVSLFVINSGEVSACPEGDYNSCVNSCEWGCQFSAWPDQCRAGCPSACADLCPSNGGRNSGGGNQGPQACTHGPHGSEHCAVNNVVYRCNNGVYEDTQRSCGSNAGGSCSSIAWCVTFECPNGDTNGDKQCTLYDEGATEVYGTGTNCPVPKCGQRDFYHSGPQGNWEAFCSYDSYFLDCGEPQPPQKRFTCGPNGQCVESEGGAYTTAHCDNMCQPPQKKYACNYEGQCVEKVGGPYTSSNCNNECQPPRTFCGDGIIQSPNSDGKFEECDDGELNGQVCDPMHNYGGSCEYCSADCRTKRVKGPFCGDYAVDEGEECDDGNTVSGDGCNAHCKLEFCGDGIKQPGEQCDFGQDNSYTCEAGYEDSCEYCKPYVCKLREKKGPFCGDGVKQSQYEECDGNDGVGPNQECNSYCKLVDKTFCGDGIKQRPNDQGKYEECDGTDGVGEHQKCNNHCRIVDLTYCGDGIKQTPNDEGKHEQCDGNDGVGSNQECNSYCKLVDKTYCGDGVVQKPNDKGQHEQCDDGSQNGKECTPGWNGECTYCTNHCKEKKKTGPSCQDECQHGDKMCSGNDLLECGNFDDDPCLEFKKKKSCEFTQDKDTYYQCEEGSSVGYKDVRVGFCKDREGYNDYCSHKTETKKIKEENCAETTCTTDTFCKNNDIYSEKSCWVGGCNENTGHCTMKDTVEVKKVEDCGNNEHTGEFCDGENIVSGKKLRYCEDTDSGAVCKSRSKTEIVESCGPDSCTEFTNKNPFVKEHVVDEDSCTENGYAYCSVDPGTVYDFCVNDHLLNQAICQGNDHNFELFDCNQYDGCYDYEFVAETSCKDTYWGCSKKKTVTKTGQQYRDYMCGNSVCSYVVDMQDIDNDGIDDRCDSCIDQDHDGICDDVDNCPEANNQNQIDRDNDGIGDRCDFDRDGDGYSQALDCNDWNDEIHPGMTEIPNNGRDDDCDANTQDRFSNNPRAMHVDIVTSSEKEIRPGKDMTVIVSVKNQGTEDLDDLKITVAMPGLGIKRSKLIGDLNDGRSETETFVLDLPNYFPSNYEPLLVTVSNDHTKRRIYREVRLN